MGYYKNINLLNFRNFDNLSLVFSKNCNVIYGKNGVGKTNILEALSLFSKGRGLRNDKFQYLIKKDCNNLVIKSDFVNNNISYGLNVETFKTINRIKKVFSINDDKSNDISNNFLNSSPFLFFLPETERIFLSSPSKRRNFIDRFIFTYEFQYNKLVNEYNKNIIERSKLLQNTNYDEVWINKIEEKISFLGLKIYKTREKQINSLILNLNFYLKTYNLPYLIKVQLLDNFFHPNLKTENYVSELRNSREYDRIIGGSKIGPHKSDYFFNTNSDFAVSQLSTGQQKTIILLIFLSQCKYLIEVYNSKPILLLDEICSHIDEMNRSILLKLIESFDLQIFMTGTTKNLFSFLSTNTNFCNITIK